MGRKWAIADVAPAINAAEHTATSEASSFDPVQVRLDRAQLAQ